MNITTLIANGIKRCLCEHSVKHTQRVLSNACMHQGAHVVKSKENTNTRASETKRLASDAPQQVTMGLPAIKEDDTDICEEEVLFRGSEFEFPCLNQR